MAQTKLERGVRVKINEDELKFLKENHNGFLDYQNYPDEYKKIAEYGEVGRFLIFRFFAD